MSADASARVAWEVVAYEPKHRSAVLALMAAVQGHQTTPEEFRWYFERNPVAPTNIYLAIYEGRVIGVSCHNTFRLCVDGQEQLVSFPLNVLTDENYRGQGVFSRLERANEAQAQRAGIELMLSFPNAQSTPIFVAKLGWSEIQGPAYLIHPLRADRLLSRVLARAKLPPALGVVGRLANPLASLFHRAPRGGLTVEPIDRFEPWVDELYGAVKARWRRSFVRSADYLNWRFIQVPHHDYRAFAVRAEGRIAGYFVVGVTEKLGLQLGYVADLLVADPAHAHAARSLAVERLLSRRVDAILQLAHEELAPTLRSLRSGFIPTPKHLTFICKDDRADAMKDGAFAIGAPGAWTIQLGDLDFF